MCPEDASEDAPEDAPENVPEDVPEDVPRNLSAVPRNDPKICPQMGLESKAESPQTKLTSRRATPEMDRYWVEGGPEMAQKIFIDKNQIKISGPFPVHRQSIFGPRPGSPCRVRDHNSVRS